MRLPMFECEICEEPVNGDQIPVLGLKFHGSLPGEFTEHDPIYCGKHVCLPCAKQLARILQQWERKEASE